MTEKKWELKPYACLEKVFTTTDGQTVTVQATRFGAAIKDTEDMIFDLLHFAKGSQMELFEPEQIEDILRACLDERLRLLNVRE